MSSKLDKILKRRKSIYKEPPPKEEDQFVVYGHSLAVPNLIGDISVGSDFSAEMYVSGNMVIDGEVTYSGAVKYDLETHQMLVYDGSSWRPLSKDKKLLSPSPTKVRFIPTVAAASIATIITGLLLLSLSHNF